jgi:hypothetical protein
MTTACPSLTLSPTFTKILKTDPGRLASIPRPDDSTGTAAAGTLCGATLVISSTFAPSDTFTL